MTNNHDALLTIPTELLDTLNKPITEEAGVLPPTVVLESEVDRALSDVAKKLKEKLNAPKVVQK